MSILEITDLIESHNRIEYQRMKETAIFNQVLANQIAERIGLMFNDKDQAVQLTNLWDFFPGLFDEEKITYEKEKELEELESLKQKRRDFVTRYKNSQKGGKL